MSKLWEEIEWVCIRLSAEGRNVYPKSLPIADMAQWGIGAGDTAKNLKANMVSDLSLAPSNLTNLYCRQICPSVVSTGRQSLWALLIALSSAA
jgi:hypothetical protein